MLPVALGLGAAFGIGLSNVTAGFATRRLSPVAVGFWSQATGVLWCTLLLLLLRPPLLPGQVPVGLVAGLAGGAGIALLFRAMATGAISLVAPITACAVVLPVVYAIASGETPTPLAMAGIVVIIAGILLASLQQPPVPGDPTDTGVAGDRRAILLAIAAATAFGAFFIVLDLAPVASGWGVLWTAAAARYSGFSVQAALALHGFRMMTAASPQSALASFVHTRKRVPTRRSREREKAARTRGQTISMQPDSIVSSRRDRFWPGRLAPLILFAGTLDVTSLILINFGATTDSYGIVTALVGLYPVVSALLGVLLLGERLTRLQATGASLAMSGVMLISI